MDGLFIVTPLTIALAVAGALAIAATAAALLILRDHLRLETRLRTLEGETETLQDRLWRAQESEHFFRTLAESQVDAIVQRDAQGRITWANDGFAALVGMQRAAVLGTAHAPRVVESRPPRLRPDGARLVDEAIETAEGVRWIGWIETQAPGRRGSLETLRAGREITERVSSETALADARARAEAASEAKSRFLATVSHEFRTPLGGILGMADLILDTRCDPEQTTYAQAIKTSGTALLSLIDEILDFSRIEAGKLTLTPAPFDLAACVEGVVELLAPRAQGKGIEVAGFASVALPTRLVGDEARIRQILVNLAGNAVKFTESGGVGVEALPDDEGGGIVLRVSDTGPGIAPERIPALFEEFEQGDGSAARRHPGTGLGLAITQRLVAGMGGEIAVESAPGEGARFTVRLPLPAAPAADRPAREATDPAVALAGKRILVLARSPFEAPFIARRLEEVGARTSVVGTEGETLAKIAMADPQDGFDALIVDCALGDDLARDVAAAAREAGVSRAVVLLSPFERRDLGSPTAAGYDSYLVKPVRARSLVERLVEPVAPRPIVPAQAEEESGTPRALRRLPGERGNAPRPGAPRVLLAEDNEINALLALKALEKRGAVVDWAKDGHEAVALAEASFAGLRPDYDVVLMDIRMPELDGLEATRRIRTLERALGRRRPRRIVALTANVLKEDEEAARAAGLDGFLPKPFEPRMLDALIGDALVGQPASGEASLAQAG
ncbi:ATP-binding protein [Salinarimonas ramus]|uniref:histidine kinase n=1 Tax=Salinarimonas ramus TaxID=690164 RepID=A0A917Q9A3_9HYPH|nr:ATP-binding protein [Salinarimonas ramus]GGK36605.1 hybrid sensor histidine kinase/response regulator [Salinarimonas ramus]